VSVGDSSVPLMADCLQPEQAVVDLGADVLPEVPVLA
jgi:hypothetical protein